MAEEVDLVITADPRIGRLAVPATATVPLISVSDQTELAPLLETADDNNVRQVAIVAYRNQISVDLPLPWSQSEYRDEPLQVLLVTR